jgi:excisionase family DNA binding protein
VSLSEEDIGLLTIAEAADVAEVTPSTIRVWIARHKLPTTRVQGRVMLHELAFLDCERARRNTPEGRAWREKRGLV